MASQDGYYNGSQSQSRGWGEQPPSGPRSNDGRMNRESDFSFQNGSSNIYSGASQLTYAGSVAPVWWPQPNNTQSSAGSILGSNGWNRNQVIPAGVIPPLTIWHPLQSSTSMPALQPTTSTVPAVPTPPPTDVCQMAIPQPRHQAGSSQQYACQPKFFNLGYIISSPASCKAKSNDRINITVERR